MNIDSITKSEVKHLVNTNQWYLLGVLFNFTPVYHAGFSNFIDWRCVPESVMLLLQGDKATPAIIADKKRKPDSTKKPSRPKTEFQHRGQLHEIQGGVCHYCKKRVSLYEWSVDHRLPFARGGTNVAQNRIGCCKPCNNQKGPLTEEEFLELRPGTDGIGERCKIAIKQKWFPAKSVLRNGIPLPPIQSVTVDPVLNTKELTRIIGTLGLKA